MGVHSLTAQYSGDQTFAPSVSVALSVTIAKLPTTVTLTSALNPAAPGNKLTFVATVSVATAKGYILIKDGATVIRAVTFLGGPVTVSGITLPKGSHTITAYYSGDESDLPSTSAPVTQVINSRTPDPLVNATRFASEPRP